MHLRQNQPNTFRPSLGHRLFKILLHAKTTVPHYHEALRNLPLEKDSPTIDFSTFFGTVPILTRSEVAASPKSFVSSLIKDSDLITQKTSGSSGSPLTLFKSKFEAAVLARELLKLRNEWCGNFSQTPKAMFIGGPGYEVNLAPTVRSADDLSLNLNLVSLDAQTCLQYLELIAKHRSQWMTCNTTIALTLASEALNYPSLRRKLNLKWIELLGQYVSSEDKKAIIAGLGARVVSHYGCWELYTMAYDRPCGHMHLLDEHVLLEILDMNTGKPSTEGETVVTGLKNFTMPFIRYKLRDVVRLSSQRCPKLHTPILEVLRGRVYNYIKGPHRYDGEHFFNFAFKDLEDKGFAPLTQFQVRQTGINGFTIFWVADSPLSSEFKKTLTSMMRNRLGESTCLKWQRKECILPSSKGSVAAFVSEI